MNQFQLPPFGFLLLCATALIGCGGALVCAVPAAQNAQNATVNLRPYADPWSKATPRVRDIANTLFSPPFAQFFSNARASIALSYDRAPSAPYFTGHLTARGLKPNFAYQIKLAGRPIYGSRGAGTARSYVEADGRFEGANPILRVVNDAAGNPTPVAGDDWSNQQLGYAGRWWDDSEPVSTNITDGYFRRNYPAHTIYGYIFIGDLVTDSLGNADLDISAAHSYHITWQDGQSGSKDTPAGVFSVQSALPFYGYGQPLAPQKVKLWYEWQSGRAHDVRLAPGAYHCRLLVTEEAFHTSGGAGGGVWQTVFSTQPDNDLDFVIAP